MYMLFLVSIIPLATGLGIFQASDQDFASCMRSEQSRTEIEFRPNEVELRVQRRDAPISTPYKLDRSPSMSHHPHGDVDQHAIKIMFEGLRRGRQAGIELSTTIGEISRGILSTKIPGETFNHATGRALAATRQKAEGSSKSPDELARSVLFAQAVFETRFAVASEDPTRPGTPDLGELKLQAGLARGFRRAIEVRLGHDIETGDPINVNEHARTVHAAMKRQARLMDQDGSCDILAHAQGLYKAATGQVHRDEGLRTRREQLAASRQRN